jgi:hypothetical protein
LIRIRARKAAGFGPVHEFIGNIIEQLQVETVDAIGFTALFFIILKAAKKKYVAAVVVGLVWASLSIAGFNLPLEAVSALVVAGILTFVMARLGTLALIAQLYVGTLAGSIPFSLDFNRWYTTRSVAFAACLLAVTAYFVRIALGSRLTHAGAED